MEQEKSEYDIKAEKFLKETETEFKAVFLRNDFYFDGDEETRDIFKITLKRGNKKYTFKFGQSIANIGKTPTPYDFLSCITKYNPYTFEDFCGEYGYDTDSRKTEKTYKAVVKEWEKVSDLYTSEEIEKLQEIN